MAYTPCWSCSVPLLTDGPPWHLFPAAPRHVAMGGAPAAACPSPLCRPVCSCPTPFHTAASPERRVHFHQSARPAVPAVGLLPPMPASRRDNPLLTPGTVGPIP